MKKGWGLTAYAALFMVFVYGPVLILPLFSFNDSTFATFPLAGFTTRHYSEMWSQGPLIAALFNSLRIGVAVTVLTTAIAVPAAISITRYRYPGKPAILSMLFLPLVVPSIVLAVALLVIILKFLNIPLSLWTVASGHVLVALPFCVSVEHVGLAWMTGRIRRGRSQPARVRSTRTARGSCRHRSRGHPCAG